MSGLPPILTKQIGPLPGGVWLAAIVGGLGIGYVRRRNAAAAAAAAASTTPGPTGSSTPSSTDAGAIDSPDMAPVVLSPAFYVDTPPATVVNGVTAPGPAPTIPSSPVPSAPSAPSPAPRPSVPARTVTMPAPKAPASPAPARTHVVASGDTLWALAIRYGTTSGRIYSANASTIEAAARLHGRSSSDAGHWIYPGTRLVIP